MITIIVSPPVTKWAEPTADHLRDRGLKVVRLGTLSIIGYLLTSDKIAAVVLHEDCIPTEWPTVRERMTRLAPNCKIVIISRNEQRTPAELAALVTEP